MKRIEMIWDIASEIILSGIDNGFDISYDKAQDMADKVLKRAEKEGMKPPEYVQPWIEEIDPPQMVDGVPMIGFITDKILNEWEPE